jgi:hypothetical protein
MSDFDPEADDDFRIPESGSAQRRFVDHFVGRSLRILDDLDEHAADPPQELADLAEDVQVCGALTRDRLAGPATTAIAPILAVYESLRAEALSPTGASATAGEWLRALVRMITALLRRLACLLAATGRPREWTLRGPIAITYGEHAPRHR